MKINILIFFKNLWRTRRLHATVTRIIGTLRDDLCTVMIIHRRILLRMRNVSDEICGKTCQLDATDVFYCRSYCLLNMFQALYAHHQELESIIQMVAACGFWCFGFQVVGMV